MAMVVVFGVGYKRVVGCCGCLLSGEVVDLNERLVLEVVGVLFELRGGVTRGE